MSHSCGRGIGFDSCFTTSYYSKTRPRPIPDSCLTTSHNSAIYCNLVKEKRTPISINGRNGTNQRNRNRPWNQRNQNHQRNIDRTSTPLYRRNTTPFLPYRFTCVGFICTRTSLEFVFWSLQSLRITRLL